MRARVGCSLAAAAVILVVGACKAPTDPGPSECRVTGVAVALGQAAIDVGAATSANATITQQNCGSLTPSWSSERPDVATVSATGTVTGVGPGTAAIRATVAGVVGSADVTVRAVCAVSSVAVTPAQSTVFVNGTVTLTAAVQQQGCSGVTPTWESLQPAFATVSGGGVVTGVAPGTATIRATANGVSGTAEVVVQAPPLGAVWTTSRLVVAGTGQVPLGNLRGVAVFGPNSVFTSSEQGVFRYDGSTWTRVRGVAASLEGLWGMAANDLFVVGQGGLIERYNGTTWTPMASGTGETLTDVWGASNTAVFAVGTNGVIRRFDGTSWSAQASQTSQWLWGVHGSGPTNVIAVGEGGTILRYDGTSWSPMASPTTDAVVGVRVFSPTDAIAVGGGGVVLRYNGTAWTQVATLNTISLVGVWGPSASDLYAVGAHGYAAHFDGTTWTELDSRIGYTLEAVAGTGSSAFAVGRSSVTMLTPAAATRVAYTPDLRGVWGLSATSAVATTDVGLIWRYTNGVWQVLDTGTRHRFRGVWASGPGDIVVVGGQYPVNSGAAVTTFNGTSWTTATVPGVPYLSSAWGAGSANVFAFGGFDAAATWNGAAWAPLAAGTFGTIEAAWGTSANDVLAVGRNGVTLRYDGTTWTIGTIGVSQRANGVWGSSTTNYYAVTDAGSVFRFNGTGWTQVFDLPTSLHGVAGSGPNEVLAIGYNGEIARYDGSTWSKVFNGIPQEVAQDIHWAGGRFFAVGNHGFVMMTP